jgi:hypothetical protein
MHWWLSLCWLKHVMALQEVTHLSLAGTLCALAFADGSVHVIETKQASASPAACFQRWTYAGKC